MKTRPELDLDSNTDYPVLEPGVYMFRVHDAEETVSKSGNPMIKLQLHCMESPDHRPVTVWDYLVGSESMEWKLRHFCRATGLLSKYESGDITALDCYQTTGQVALTIEDDPKYGRKNKVKDYKGEGEEIVESASEPRPEGADIPF